LSAPGLIGAFTAPSPILVAKGSAKLNPIRSGSSSVLFSEDDERLQRTFGGYTVKQRLREEIESPFRAVRLLFFGASSVSALLALYFSVTNMIKANMGYESGPSMEDAVQSTAINVAALAICAFITYRDYQAGQASLARIAKGGALAKLIVNSSTGSKTTLKDYRRVARVLICAGGPEYIATLANSLQGTKQLTELLVEADIVLVPVLLQDDASRVGDTKMAWPGEQPAAVAFPMAVTQWMDYLSSEVSTASSQGFDVMNKGLTIIVKKNGRILRRATGQPQFGALLETMEVMDGSKFGMPGDDEKYGS